MSWHSVPRSLRPYLPHCPCVSDLVALLGDSLSVPLSFLGWTVVHGHRQAEAVCRGLCELISMPPLSLLWVLTARCGLSQPLMVTLSLFTHNHFPRHPPCSGLPHHLPVLSQRLALLPCPQEKAAGLMGIAACRPRPHTHTAAGLQVPLSVQRSLL